MPEAYIVLIPNLERGQHQTSMLDCQGVSQKIKTADIFSKLGNQTGVYKFRHHGWPQQKIFLVKPVERWKITLIEGEGIINDRENAEILNAFFSNAVKNVKIPEYQETDSLGNNISLKIFKAILKYRNHPSIVAIKT